MTDMWEMLQSLPSQLSWAAEASVPEVARNNSVLVVGMGGSGVAGDYAGPIAAESRVRVAAHKAYDLPPWAMRERPLVVAISYSGDTEETLSAVELAQSGGLDIAAITGGGKLAALASSTDIPVISVPTGLQPRAALGYLLGALLRVAADASEIPDMRPDLAEAASVAAGLLQEEGAGLPLAADLAEGLVGRMVLVYGSEGPTGVVAGRWKTQINENAKTPAFVAVLPEADHNEISGWSAWPEVTRRAVGAVLLRDEKEHPRVSLRFGLTREAMSEGVPVVGEVHSTGSSLLARMVSLTVIGDALSIYLAESAGVDPVTVPSIDALKQALRGDS